MVAFKSNKNSPEAAPPFMFSGFNDGTNWIRASKFESDNGITRAKTKTMLKDGILFGIRRKNRLYVKLNTICF